jgi:hypothetical protein
MSTPKGTSAGTAPAKPRRPRSNLPSLNQFRLRRGKLDSCICARRAIFLQARSAVQPRGPVRWTSRKRIRFGRRFGRAHRPKIEACRSFARRLWRFSQCHKTSTKSGSCPDRCRARVLSTAASAARVRWVAGDPPAHRAGAARPLGHSGCVESGHTLPLSRRARRLVSSVLRQRPNVRHCLRRLRRLDADRRHAKALAGRVPGVSGENMSGADCPACRCVMQVLRQQKVEHRPCVQHGRGPRCAR